MSELLTLLGSVRSEGIETPSRDKLGLRTNQRVVDPSRLKIALHSEPEGLVADRFRLVRMRLKQLAAGRRSSVVLITSPLPGDGKSTVAANLAAVLESQKSGSVVLIDADLRHSTLTEELMGSTAPGLSDILNSGGEAAELAYEIQPLGFHFVSSGLSRRNPADLLQSQALVRAIASLRLRFDWIIVDSPPVLVVPDSVSISQSVDAVLMVARSGRTPGQALKDAVAAMGKDKIAGVILNDMQKRDQSYGKYKYYGPYQHAKQAGR